MNLIGRNTRVLKALITMDQGVRAPAVGMQQHFDLGEEDSLTSCDHDLLAYVQFVQRFRGSLCSPPRSGDAAILYVIGTRR